MAPHLLGVTVADLKAAGADPYDLAPLTVRSTRAKSETMTQTLFGNPLPDDDVQR